MKKADIHRIMVVFNDNDYIRVWDWIGKITLMTLQNKNICGEELLENTSQIEDFVKKAIPLAIQFTRKGLTSQNEIDRLSESFQYVNSNTILKILILIGLLEDQKFW